MPKKFIREIEEILKDAEDITGQRKQKRSFRQRIRLPGISLRHPRVSAGAVGLGGVALVLISLILFYTVRGFAALFLWAGLLLFVIAYALFFTRSSKGGSGTGYEKRWRGQPVDGESSSFWLKFKGWFKRR